MKPILYDKSETAFSHNGLGRLADCITCIVTEERNGIYECEFTYPISGEMYSKIQIGCIIGVIHDDTKDIQPFDIYAKSAPLNGIVTFYAHHISYRLGNVILKPMAASSCAGAFAAIPSNTYNRCPFTFWTDKAVSGSWKVEVPSAIKAVLGGQKGSILDVYGKGEYKWDKWTVRLYANRGNDNGVSIRYGVNLTDLQQEYDESGVYNAVAPYWQNAQDGTVVTLTNGIVSTSSGTRLVPWTTQAGEEITDSNGNVIYFKVANSIVPVPMDLSEAFEEQPTEAQLKAEALRRLNSSEAWLPSENIKVEFINLADTEEYKNVSALQRVSLCDKVSVYCGPLGVSAVKMQVIRVVYNVLTERYNEMELGKAKVSFAQSITAQVEEMTKDLPTASMMQQAINNATDKITGANGGHVRFIYDANGEMQEILIMDTDDINTAVNVWRWNSGGFGFSSNGYAGPYALAMTMDGAIVADFITAGTMSANRISGGVIDGETILAKLLQIINNNSEVIASFNDKIILGQTNKDLHVEINFNSFKLVDKDDNYFLSLGDVRNSNGISECLLYAIGDGDQIYFDTPVSIVDIISVTVDDIEVPYSMAAGYANRITLNSVPSDGSIIKIRYTSQASVIHYDLGVRKEKNANGQYSLIEGYNTLAIGKASHAEGEETIASSWASHAEGYNTRASSCYGAHAEGAYTRAYGGISARAPHAEGFSTSAYGEGCHAEGSKTEARGQGCHVEGYGTIAYGIGQHVAGTYNIENRETWAYGYPKYVEIIGNGTYVYSNTTRSNARTLTHTGNEWIAGTLTQASDSRLKEESGEIPDLSNIRVRRFKWNDKKGAHDDLDHIGYFAQDVEKIAPYLVQEDAMGYKSLDYIALLCAKVEYLERRVQELESEVKRS